MPLPGKFVVLSPIWTPWWQGYYFYQCTLYTAAASVVIVRFGAISKNGIRVTLWLLVIDFKYEFYCEVLSGFLSLKWKFGCLDLLYLTL